MNCPSCGQPVQGGAAFCIECGAAVDASAPSDAGSQAAHRPSPPPPPSRIAQESPAESATVPQSALRWATTWGVVSVILFAALVYWSPDMRQEFLDSCNCELRPGLIGVAALTPVWIGVLWGLRRLLKG